MVDGMKAGKMDRQIIIKKKTVTENDFGEPIETWSDLDTVWAKKKELRGTERYAAKQTIAGIDAVYTIRWRPDISPLNIFECEGKEYDIYACLELGRKEGLELYAGARAE